MHDVVSVFREPGGAPGEPNSIFPVPISGQLFRSRFLTSARIKGMGTNEDKTAGDPIDPIERLRGGDRRALATLFDQYRDRLRRMVELRLDPRSTSRSDRATSSPVRRFFWGPSRAQSSER